MVIFLNNVLSSPGRKKVPKKGIVKEFHGLENQRSSMVDWKPLEKFLKIVPRSHTSILETQDIKPIMQTIVTVLALYS
jgi:hypothetical protein